VDAKEIAQELRDKLRKYEDFIGLYLYGSYIKGKATPDSDIDIVGVFSTNRDYSEEVIADAWDLEIDKDIVIDFHPMTPAQLNFDWIYFNEIKKGIYYAR
jgi:predicted nucleotidyltransferase